MTWCLAAVWILLASQTRAFTFMPSVRLAMERASDCYVCDESVTGSSGHEADTICNGALRRCEYGCLTELTCDNSIPGARVRITKQCIQPGSNPCPATNEFFPTAWGFSALHKCVAKECCNRPGCNENAGSRLQPFLYDVCADCRGCQYNPCMNGGSCVSDNGLLTCLCQLPYTGDTCQEHVCGKSNINSQGPLQFQKALGPLQGNFDKGQMECTVSDEMPSTIRTWRLGIIPYIIETDGYTDSDVAAIEAGIQHLISATMVFGRKCIDFVPRTTENDYVAVYNGHGCFSSVGLVGGRQDLSLNADGCMRLGTILHEFLHVLGFYHEHTRMDRDNFIHVNWNNIIPGYETNFAHTESSHEDSPYVYGSVMHYSPWAFALDDETPTIWTCDPEAMAVIGQQLQLHQTDITRVQQLYHCI